MWHKKQQNLNSPGQMTHPERVEGVHVEKKMLLPRSGISDINFLVESSRKRKSEALDQQGTVSQSVLEDKCSGETNLQHKAGALLGTNVQRCTNGLFSSQSIEPISTRHQSEKRQFHGQNDLAITWQGSNVNDHKTGIEKITSHSVSVPPQSTCHRVVPSTLSKMSNRDALKIPNWQTIASDIFRQSDHQAFSFLNSCNTSLEKAVVAPGLQDLTAFLGHKDHVTNSSLMELCNSQSESLRPPILMPQSLVKPDRFSVHMEGKSSLEQRQHGSNTQGCSDISTLGAASSGASACMRFEQNENSGSLENEVQSSSAALVSNVKEKDQGHGEGNIKIMEHMGGSNIENSKNLASEGTSTKNDDSLGNNIIRPCQRNDQSHGSVRLDEKSKPLAGKVAQTVAEKLWDGFLQLNSSVSVTAVAFFKSGEKIPDVNWSELVEVKGKVRLEAFEKYIKDLPRSRNRGLMVVSLYWKEGSSESGLAGMKQVAKGYKEGERVGFAHLSAGTDIYICPRSDTIITILAKYGFFKGMAAVEDNPDSLIGCVVWRRNQIPSNPVGKNSERKNCTLSDQPLNSPDSSNQPAECSVQVAGKKLPLPQPAHDPLALVTERTTLQNSGDAEVKSKNAKSTQVQLQVGSSQTEADSLLNLSVPSKPSSTPQGFPTSSPSDCASHQGRPMEHMLGSEAPLLHISESGKSEVSLELEKPVHSLPCSIIKQSLPTSYDDDLPEFDFGTACGAPQSPAFKPLGAQALEKRLPSEGLRKANMPVVPNLQSMPVLNRKNPEDSTFPKLQIEMNQGMPPLKKVCHRNLKIPVSSIMGEYAVQGRPVFSPVGAAAITPLKNLFDNDDDDMPEWCPPSLEVHKQSVAETTRPSTTAFPSVVPNSSFESLPPSQLGPVLFSPSTAGSLLSFPSQMQPRALHCPISTTLSPAQPGPTGGYTRRGPNSMRGFNSNPPSRPLSNQFVKLPVHPTDKRGWKG